MPLTLIRGRQVSRIRASNLFFALVLSNLLAMHAALADEVVRIVAREHAEGGSLEIPPDAQVVLDATAFQFESEEAQHQRPPDTVAVQILHDGKSLYYSTPLPESRVVELSARNLRPRKSPPFEGFPREADVFVLVGREVSPSGLDYGIFSHDWSFVLRVR